MTLRGFEDQSFDVPCQSCHGLSPSGDDGTTFYSQWKLTLCYSCAQDEVFDAFHDQAEIESEVKVDPWSIQESLIHAIDGQTDDLDKRATLATNLHDALDAVCSSLLFEPDHVGPYQFIEVLSMSLESYASKQLMTLRRRQLVSLRAAYRQLSNGDLAIERRKVYDSKRDHDEGRGPDRFLKLSAICEVEDEREGTSASQ